MDNFWVFLEVMAGILEEPNAVERLNAELDRMSDTGRRQAKRELALVTTEVSHLATRAIYNANKLVN